MYIENTSLVVNNTAFWKYCKAELSRELLELRFYTI